MRVPTLLPAPRLLAPQGVTKFRAKIGETNTPSIQLMSKLGFAHVSRSEIFKEVTLELRVEGATAERLAAVAAGLQCSEYDAGSGSGGADVVGSGSDAEQRQKERPGGEQQLQQPPA